MGGGFYGTFLDTIGMEFEGIGFTTSKVKEILTPMLMKYSKTGNGRIQITTDASTEFYADPIPTGGNYIFVSQHTPAAKKLVGMGRGNSQTFGYEICTLPLSIQDFEETVYPMVYALEAAGDFVSDRASIHFHVGFVNNLKMLKNLLRINLQLDPVLFRLGGMGRTFRGHCNNSAYARPLLNSTAAPVRIRKSKNSEDALLASYLNAKSDKQEIVRVINPMAALNAKNLEDFWAGFGIDYGPGGAAERYHPSRYLGCNFYSIPQHGTAEYRHFNSSHNPMLIVGIGKFLRMAVELATVINKEEAETFEVIPSNTEVSVSDAVDTVRTIVSMAYSKKIEDIPSEEELNVILSTISESHFKDIPEIPVMTHLKEKYIFSDVAERGQLEVVKKFLPANHVDIHTIGSRVYSMLDEINLKNE